MTTGNGGNQIAHGKALPPREEIEMEPDSWTTVNGVLFWGVIALCLIAACGLFAGIVVGLINR